MNLLDTFFSDPFATDVWQPEQQQWSNAPSDVDMSRPHRLRGSQWAANPPGINMDFLEKDGKYVLHADMPGYKKEDIHINIDSGVLHLRGVKKQLPVEAHASYFRRERTHGLIRRSLRLPLDCDTAAQAEVDYTHGVLNVTFQKLSSSSSTVKKLMIK